MLIFNKRSSSSSSAHSNRYLSNQPESAIIKQDFIDHNCFHNEDEPPPKDRNSTGNANALSTDENIQMEETVNECVYQITIKKVYNKKLQEETKNVIKVNNIYGTYRPISNSFFSYTNINDHADTNNPALGSQAKDGLIYTRVKLRQLKYCSLPNLIMHLTNEETGQMDLNLVQIFLVTYRTFTDTITAIKLLRNRYEEILPASLEMTEDVRVEHLKSIRTILHMWLENYVEDFNEPPDYTNLNVLRSFVNKHMANTEMAHVVQTKIEFFESLVNSSQINSSNSRLSSLLSIKINLNDKPLPNDQDINQMHTSFASTSQFSISPTTSQHSSSSHRPLSHTIHRRSSSNVPLSLKNHQTQSTPICEFIPHNYGRANAISSSLVHSRSQNNISQSTGQTKSPILNLISNSLAKKSNHVLISSINGDQLLEAGFMQIDSNYLAEQLTYVDKSLFPKVCAHLCLGGVWSTRYRKNNATDVSLNSDLIRNSNGASSPTSMSVNSNNSTPLLSDKFATIGAFIDQFNCVSFVVQATVLENIELKPSERARIIKKWIEVALACRGYKNFSSLNAIVQGLNTQCVSRLVKTWNEIANDVKSQFDELTQMFSEDQNQKEFRSILSKDLEEYAQIFDVYDKIPPMGFTSVTNSLIQKSQESPGKDVINGISNKYADINGGINVTLGRKYKENLKKKVREPLGTIPFLGTFLKDLEYLNAQNPKEKDKINVMQKRKEFEIISQIKLLQQACQLYTIKSNPDFKTWLHKQTVYSEEQNYKFSYLIESRGDSENNAGNRKSKTNTMLLSESTDSILSSILTGNNKTPQSSTRNFNHSRHSSIGNNSGFTESFNKSTNSPMIQSQISQTNSAKDSSDGYFPAQNNNYSSISSLSSSNTTSPNLVVKVIIEFTSPSENLKIDEKLVANTVMYKRIFIKDSDRTKDVKKTILEKFLLNPETCDKFSLVQVFGQSNQKELPIGDNCNVYYAAKNVPDMQFILRRRNSGSNNQLLTPSSTNTNSINGSNQQQNGNMIKSTSSVFRSPVMHHANKFAKNLKNRRKTEQIVQSHGTYSRVFDDLPPHYPNK